MRETILQKLSEIESEHDVKILYACESGSRAWGFASPDSDYDVRFIYVHKASKYLSIENMKDVIELPVNELLDIAGWDIKKALVLLRKSNAAIYEWLQSPVVYLKDENFHQSICALMSVYFAPLPGYHHYSSMAKNCLENDLKHEQVKLKKYFYALRPILAAKWIIDKMEVPPMEFNKLLPLITNSKVNDTIADLLKVKAVSDEKYLMPPVEILNSFIEEQLAYCDSKKHLLTGKETDAEKLNQLFGQVIGIQP
jgi:predicted nucleotidyltransferase